MANLYEIFAINTRHRLIAMQFVKTILAKMKVQHNFKTNIYTQIAKNFEKTESTRVIQIGLYAHINVQILYLNFKCYL